ncbi:hypothetical protein BRC75_06165 [Halobacteriales archaeon QH_7_69_31]|nr:MAG: hypothetical protein BRC75_06165 [Halobacteriales archaeon QH_7_69_31]
MLRSVLGLSTRERLLVAEAAVLLVGVGTAVRVVAYTRVRALLGSLPAPLLGSDTAREDVGWAVDAADRATPGDRSCLVRALVAEAMLERRGHETVLRFGVDDAGADMEAHAWLESNDEIIVGGENREEYSRLEASG